MATNLIYEPGYKRAMVCTSPTTPTSGAPVRVGRRTGIALVDEGGGGAAATETVVDAGPFVATLSVDDNLGTGIAVGDLIYYHDTATGTPATNLNNDPAGADAFFGFAEEVVEANATTTIRVFHSPESIASAVADGALSGAILGTDNGLGFLRAARFEFNPTANAGERTVAAHGLGVTLPDNADVLGGYIEILSTFTSGDDSGTIALSIEGANDLVTATAISSGTFWDAVKGKVVVPTALEAGGVATSIKLSEAREITATVGTQALTGGKLVGWLFYVIGD